MAIDCLVLGAGQDVGKSCVVVSMNGKRIMFDCGIHLHYIDHRRYPDFSLIPKPFDQSIDCVIITHFHLDHIGALPFFTEVCGYTGPIYMTYPTKALAPIMLEDYRKVMVERRGEEEQFTSEDIAACMKKVIAIDLKQTIQVDKDLQIRAYYAGHVLGAAMFYAKVGSCAVLYTGDYNMTPDRHLGAAQIDRLELDLVITESTYATTIRDPKYIREREFLKAVHKCISGGGKVLIPTFAVGRAQELCILLEDYWERMNLKVPIYFSAGLTNQANIYYKMLISWTSQKIKETYSSNNAFEFKNIKHFDRSMIGEAGPCVLFATPGMLNGGFSLEVFKHWAPSERNLVTLPGFCSPGSLGQKLMSGKTTTIDLENDTRINVRCQIHQLAFSPHTDSKGIMDLIKFLSPKHVILVHGEPPKITKLKARIQSELGIDCFDPANHETVSIPSTLNVQALASDAFLQSCLNPNFKFLKSSSVDVNDSCSEAKKATSVLQVVDERVAEGIFVMEKSKKAKVVHQDELLTMLEQKKHNVQHAYCFPVCIGNGDNEDRNATMKLPCSNNRCFWFRLVLDRLSDELPEANARDFGEYLEVQSFRLSICSNDDCSYRISDEQNKLGSFLLLLFLVCRRREDRMENRCDVGEF